MSPVFYRFLSVFSLLGLYFSVRMYYNKSTDFLCPENYKEVAR